MMKPSPEISRPPFLVQRRFIETAFESRFQGLLRAAQQNRSWHIIAAVPGSGKSLGIADLGTHRGERKQAGEQTCLPLLAIRSPKNSATEQALGQALSAAFGVVPHMPWYARRTWLVQMMASTSVECIIIDDAQDLSRHHFAFLKELTDNLAAPPYERQIGLCLVVAHNGNGAPFKEIFARPEIIWRQFERRFDTEYPVCTVLGHTTDEVRDILTTFEDLYQDQLPDLRLRPWADSICAWLTSPILDPDGTKRVTMDHLTRLVTTSLRRAYEQGATNVEATLLSGVANLLLRRRNEMIPIDGSASDKGFPVREVG